MADKLWDLAHRSKFLRAFNLAPPYSMSPYVPMDYSSMGGPFGRQPFSKNPFYKSKGPSGSSVPPIVTSQHDFTPTFRRRRRRVSRRLRKFRRKLRRKFRSKVKKALGSDYHFTCFYSVGRSALATSGTQQAVYIPFFSYRDATGSFVSSTRGAGAPAAGGCLGPRNDAVTIKNLVDNEVFYPSGAAANTAQSQWWFQAMWASIDLTITNGGLAADTYNAGASSSQNPLEYEIFICTLIKSLPKDETETYSNLSQIIQWANSLEQPLGGISANTDLTYTSLDWSPFATKSFKKTFKTNMIGRGYISPGNSVRIFKSIKLKKMYHWRSWANDNASDNCNRIFRKGDSFMLVLFRGTLSDGNIAGASQLTQARLNLSCNKKFGIKTHAVGQSGKYEQRALASPNYA